MTSQEKLIKGLQTAGNHVSVKNPEDGIYLIFPGIPKLEVDLEVPMEDLLSLRRALPGILDDIIGEMGWEMQVRRYDDEGYLSESWMYEAWKKPIVCGFIGPPLISSEGEVLWSKLDAIVECFYKITEYKDD